MTKVAAVAGIQSLAWELPDATGVARKKTKTKYLKNSSGKQENKDKKSSSGKQEDKDRIFMSDKVKL